MIELIRIQRHSDDNPHTLQVIRYILYTLCNIHNNSICYALKKTLDASGSWEQGKPDMSRAADFCVQAKHCTYVYLRSISFIVLKISYKRPLRSSHRRVSMVHEADVSLSMIICICAGFDERKRLSISSLIAHVQCNNSSFGSKRKHDCKSTSYNQPHIPILTSRFGWRSANMSFVNPILLIELLLDSALFLSTILLRLLVEATSLHALHASWWSYLIICTFQNRYECTSLTTETGHANCEWIFFRTCLKKECRHCKTCSLSL